PERGFGLLVGHDLAINLLLAHAPRNELRHLRAEVDDQDFVVHTSAPNPKSARQCRKSDRELRVQRGTTIISVASGLRFRSSHESMPRGLANFGIGPLARPDGRERGGNRRPFGLAMWRSRRGRSRPRWRPVHGAHSLTRGDPLVRPSIRQPPEARITDTKKPSVSVRRGVISRPSSDISTARRNSKARSPSAFATSLGR